MDMKAFAERIAHADMGPIEDLIVVYTRAGEPHEQHVIAYPGINLEEKLEACATEVEQIIYVVDGEGAQMYL